MHRSFEIIWWKRWIQHKILLLLWKQNTHTYTLSFNMFFTESDWLSLFLGGWQTYQMWNQYSTYSRFNWVCFSVGKHFSTVLKTTLKIGRYPFKGHLYWHILSTSIDTFIQAIETFIQAIRFIRIFYNMRCTADYG